MSWFHNNFYQCLEILERGQEQEQEQSQNRLHAISKTCIDLRSRDYGSVSVSVPGWNIVKSKSFKRREDWLEKLRNQKKIIEEEQEEKRIMMRQKFIEIFWDAFEYYVGGHAFEKSMECTEYHNDGSRTYRHNNVDPYSDTENCQEIDYIGTLTVTPPSQPSQDVLNKLFTKEFKLRYCYCRLEAPITASFTTNGPIGCFSNHKYYKSLKFLEYAYSRARNESWDIDPYPYPDSDTASDSDYYY